MAAESNRKFVTVLFEGAKAKSLELPKDHNPAIIGRYESILQQVNTGNQNGRRYMECFWDKWLNAPSTKAKLEGKLLLGQFSHPRDLDDGSYYEKLTSHAITKIWREGNDIKGIVEVFATHAGKDLQVLLEAGVRLGVSSRALAVSEYNEGFEDIVDGDIFGWDYVVDPSVKCAIPKAIGENIFCKGSGRVKLENIAKSEDTDAQVILEALGYKKEDAAKLECTHKCANCTCKHTETENKDENKTEETPQMATKEVAKEVEKQEENTEVKEILTKAAAEKVELESRIEKLESDLSNTQTKASKASKTYKKMRESFVKVAKALRNRVVAESKKAADVSAKLEGTAALSKEEAVALRTKILQLEAAQNRTVERTAAICTELRDLVKKAQFEGARKGFAAKQATEKAEKLTAEVEQLKQENNERVVRMFAENTLYSLGEESNPKLKKLLESCTTLEEVQEVRDKFEELHKVMEESLPIEGINTRYLAEEVESALGKSTLSSDPETARLEKMFLKGVK